MISTRRAIKKKRKKERKHALDQEAIKKKRKHDNGQVKKKEKRYRPRKRSRK